MTEQTFNLVFRGEILEGQMVPDVKLRVGRLLKADRDQMTALFSGNVVILKKAVDRATAAQYQAAFRKAGARLRVQQVGGDASEPADDGPNAGVPARPVVAAAPSASVAPAGSAQDGPTRTAGRQASASASARGAATIGSGPAASVDAARAQAANGRDARVEAPPRKTSLAERLAAEGLRSGGYDPGPAVAPADPRTVGTAANQVSVKVPDLRVAPAGADVLRPDERPRSVAVEVDTSGLSVAESGALLGGSRPTAMIDIDTSRISLATLGADLADHVDSLPLDIDTSALSLADVGVDLGPHAETIEANIDTTTLTLADPGTDLGAPERGPAPTAPDTSHLKMD